MFYTIKSEATSVAFISVTIKIYDVSVMVIGGSDRIDQKYFKWVKESLKVVTAGQCYYLFQGI